MITSISHIKLKQKEIIFKVKKYINKECSSDNDFFYKEQNYFINWAETEGKFKLISVKLFVFLSIIFIPLKFLLILSIF